MVAALLLALAAGLAGLYVFERNRRVTHAMPGGLHPEITLPHEVEFELYHNALSLCSKKARLCLAELGIEYRGHHVHLIETGAYENIGRRFLAVNPAGIVPVLVHRGHPIYESHDIIRYAAEQAPEPALIPPDSKTRDEMQRWIDRASLTGDDPLEAADASAGNAVPGLTVPLFAAMIEDIPAWRILEGLLFHRLKLRPLIFLALKVVGLRRLHRVPPMIATWRRCAHHMKVHLDGLEARLGEGGGPWILGPTFSLADVSWAVIFERLVEADALPLFLEGRPHCTRYWEQLRERPSYEAAIVGHGHPTVSRGLERLRRAKRADPTLREALEMPCR